VVFRYALDPIPGSGVKIQARLDPNAVVRRCHEILERTATEDRLVFRTRGASGKFCAVAFTRQEPALWRSLFIEDDSRPGDRIDTRIEGLGNPRMSPMSAEEDLPGSLLRIWDERHTVDVLGKAGPDLDKVLRHALAALYALGDSSLRPSAEAAMGIEVDWPRVQLEHARVRDQLMRFAARGPSRAEYVAAQEAYEAGELARSASLIAANADMGEVRARYLLAAVLGDQRYAGHDRAAADRWLNLAAEADYVPAQSALGGRLIGGRSRKQDADRSFDLSRRAAERGDKSAAYWLGIHYSEGLGTERNDKVALDWLLRAAHAGVLAAMGAVGYAYEHGLGIGADPAQAAHWYTLASDQGHAESRARLAMLLELGWGLPRDVAKACELYCSAAKAGYLPAAGRAAKLYYFGDGIERDHQKAKEMCDAGEASGVPLCLQILGYLYVDGDVFPRNVLRAYAYLRLAGRAGIVQAAEDAEAILEEMTQEQRASAKQVLAELEKLLAGGTRG